MGERLLTTSRRAAFRLCARKHDVEYVKGFRPVEAAHALRLGTATHAALEAHWNAHPLPLPDDPYDAARVRVMIGGYDAKWHGDTHRYALKATEAQFRHDLLDPLMFTRSESWVSAGKIDAILYDRTLGETVVMEHKTTTSAIGPDASYWEKLTMDDQCSAYVLGAESLGYDVSRVIYDVIRKPPNPYEATPVDKRKYRKDGGLYANQREDAESPEDYEARIRDLVLGDLDAYYARREIPRVAAQLAAYMEDTWQESLRMAHAEDNGLAPRNPDACFRFGRCWLWDHCAQGERLDEHPDKYRLATSASEELEGVDDDSTE